MRCQATNIGCQHAMSVDNSGFRLRLSRETFGGIPVKCHAMVLWKGGHVQQPYFANVQSDRCKCTSRNTNNLASFSHYSVAKSAPAPLPAHIDSLDAPNRATRRTSTKRVKGGTRDCLTNFLSCPKACSTLGLGIQG